MQHNVDRCMMNPINLYPAVALCLSVQRSLHFRILSVQRKIVVWRSVVVKLSRQGEWCEKKFFQRAKNHRCKIIYKIKTIYNLKIVIRSTSVWLTDKLLSTPIARLRNLIAVVWPISYWLTDKRHRGKQSIELLGDSIQATPHPGKKYI